jgi:hypothetical protein
MGWGIAVDAGCTAAEVIAELADEFDEEFAAESVWAESGTGALWLADRFDECAFTSGEARM